MYTYSIADWAADMITGRPKVENLDRTITFPAQFIANRNLPVTGATSCQNSNRACMAIMRGELSPPKPTPSNPVGGEVV